MFLNRQKPEQKFPFDRNVLIKDKMRLTGLWVAALSRHEPSSFLLASCHSHKTSLKTEHAYVLQMSPNIWSPHISTSQSWVKGEMTSAIMESSPTLSRQSSGCVGPTSSFCPCFYLLCSWVEWCAVLWLITFKLVIPFNQWVSQNVAPSFQSNERTNKPLAFMFFPH